MLTMTLIVMYFLVFHFFIYFLSLMPAQLFIFYRFCTVALGRRKKGRGCPDSASQPFFLALTVKIAVNCTFVHYVVAVASQYFILLFFYSACAQSSNWMSCFLYRIITILWHLPYHGTFVECTTCTPACGGSAFNFVEMGRLKKQHKPTTLQGGVLCSFGYHFLITW